MRAARPPLVCHAGSEEILGTVIVNPATEVLARYDHAYARFLAGHGFLMRTYDDRGIGASRPVAVKGCSIRWRDWGELGVGASTLPRSGHMASGAGKRTFSAAQVVGSK